jgi:hypothetical protein
VVAGEPPSDPASVLAALRSEDPKDAAWGAHLAGREGLRDAVPLLLDLLRPRPERTAEEWGFTDRAVLDALIRLEAKVPAGLLGDRLPGHRRGTSLALILVARQPVENRALLLHLFDRWTSKKKEDLYIGGLLVGNLLAAQRAPGFARRLLEEIETKFTFTVVNTPEFGL